MQKTMGNRARRADDKARQGAMKPNVFRQDRPGAAPQAVGFGAGPRTGGPGTRTEPPANRVNQSKGRDSARSGAEPRAA